MNTLRGSGREANATAHRVIRAWVRRPDCAVIFDFNGTLSDDETILLRLYTDLFRERLEWTLDPVDYYQRLAGRSDREIIGLVVAERAGGDHALARELLDECCRRYCELVAERSPVLPSTIDLVQGLHATGVPLAIVTGAMRIDVDYVLSRTPLASMFTIVVTEEDVEHGKPDPEGFYIAALELDVDPTACLVFEDSLHGIAAAHAAGMHVIAVEGTHERAELEAAADAVVARLDVSLLAALGTRARWLRFGGGR